MKLKNLFYLLLALPMVFVACEDPEGPTPDEPKTPKLTLTSGSDIYVGAEGGDGVITYTLENAQEGISLEASADVNWITNVTAGAEVTYTVAANDKPTLRSGVITVTYGEASFVVNINQLAATVDPVLTLTSNDVMEFDCLGGEGTITYTLENPVGTAEVAAVASPDATWISNIAVEDGTVKFNVAQNLDEANDRQGIITVSYATLSFEVTVKQAKNTVPTITLESRDTIQVATNGSETETIRFSLKNADTSIAVTPTANVEWIKNFTVNEDNVTCSVDANEGGERTGVVTLTYGQSSVTVTFKQAGIPLLKILSIEAGFREDNTIWDIKFVEENDGVHGEMHSRITFKLAEAITTRIPDGTYTVENGGILTNSATDNTNSIIRHDNTSLAEDIIAATITIKNDKATETTTISGLLTTGSTTYALEWSGTMPGFAYLDLEDLGEEGETEWNRFYCDGSNSDLIMLNGNGKHGLNVHFVLNKKGKKSGIEAGTFPVEAWKYSYSSDYCCGDESTVNEKHLQYTGQVVLEAVGTDWKVTFDVTDVDGKNWKGSYVGAL